jgi:deoxyadenosine/deoxycytidine kinase
MSKYIVIAGNIGAGKSTLVEKLCETVNWQPYYEPVSENPYLKDFYKNMHQWAFHSQLFFLSDRMSMHKELQEFKGHVVQDRSIYEDAEIFARNLYVTGHMNERDFQTYWKMYSIAIDLLTPPDLIVYLKASVPALKEHIKIRNRDFETSISDDYLHNLNILYEKWISKYKESEVLILNIEEYDILNRSEDLEQIVFRIQEKLRDGQGELF